ncbi:MAG: lysophospholipid acyltransferase family protein [Candidatus Omnitrophota bacterium]
MPRFICYLISPFIWLNFFVTTAVLALVQAVIVLLTFPLDPDRRLAHAQCYWWSDVMIRPNPFWSLKIEGRERVDPRRTYVIVANHQSLGDIPVIYQTHLQFKWVVKDSLFKVPPLGWCLSLCRHIRLRRGEASSIKQVYREASDWLAKGMSVLFFPEGTRSRTGEVQEFQNGAFKLAIKHKLPILPVSIGGTIDALPKHSWVFTTKVYCRIRILEPVETALLQAGDFEKLREETRDRIIASIQS